MEKNNDVYRRLGTRIREIREELGITQERLAFKAKISPSFLSHIERGTKKASLETVKRLAAAIGVPIQNLFYPPKEPVTYLKTKEDFFARKIEELVRDKGEGFKELLLKIADYLVERER